VGRGNVSACRRACDVVGSRSRATGVARLESVKRKKRRALRINLNSEIQVSSFVLVVAVVLENPDVSQ
jgi:hypothetical protein